MKIIEVDDKPLRKAVFHANNSPDNPRRYEIHFTDLINSLINSFYRKYFPAEFSERDYEQLQRWYTGKSDEIGLVDTLAPYFPQSQKITKIGVAMGSIDLVLFGDCWELTTTIFPYTKPLPYMHKVRQLSWYLASEHKLDGYLRIRSFIPNKHGKTSRTWRVVLRKKDAEHIRNTIYKRGHALLMALMSGKWRTLPRTTAKWMKEDEADTIKWLRKHPNLVEKARGEWMKGRLQHMKAERVSRFLRGEGLRENIAQ